MNSLAPLMCAVVFPFFWVASSLFFSHLGGWAQLAARYRDNRLESGPTYYFRTGSVGAINYRSCLVLRVCETGLGLSVIFPFRIGHPPLFIPWVEFHSAKVAWLLFIPVIEAYVGLPVVASVRLPI